MINNNEELILVTKRNKEYKDNFYEILFDPDTIAHFTSIETAVTKILHTGSLRFPKYRFSKDILESNLVPVQYGGLFDRSENHDVQETNKMQTDESMVSVISALDNIRVACFCMNINPADKCFDNVAAFRPRMWVQYADEHKGACLLFSKSKLIKQIEQSNFMYNDNDGKVLSYLSFEELNRRNLHGNVNQIIIEGPVIFQEKQKQLLYKNYIFSKHLDFKSENEYRIAIEFENPDSDNIIMDNDGAVRILIGDSLSAILVSEKIDLFYYDYLKNYDKTVMQLSLDFRCPVLRPLV